MKFKKKLLFGLISSTAIATSTIGLLTTAACAPVSNSNTNVTNNNEQNSAYIYLTFITQDPEVTFTGGTSVKIRSGKLFGSVIAPIATKPDSQFQYWYYIDEKGRETEIKSDTKIDGNMPLKGDKLFIYPLFKTIAPEASHVTFDANGGALEYGPSQSPFLPGQTFDSIQKPIVAAFNPDETYFIGWYTTKDDKGERVLDNFVLQNDMTVYAHYADRIYSAGGGDPIGTLLNKCDVSESLNITALSGNVTLTANLQPARRGKEFDKAVAYYWDNDPGERPGSTLQNGILFRDDNQVVIPEGHTICLVSGLSSFYGPYFENRGSYAFSEGGEYNTFSFYGGEVSLSGSVEGLLDWGDSKTQIDDLTQVPGDYSGEECFAQLFVNADEKPDPDNPTRLYLSNDISYQKRGFLPATTVSFGGYSRMFMECETITSIPEYFLRGRSLYDACYMKMFTGCRGIETIPSTLFGPSPIIRFQNMKEYGENYFTQMFTECSSLTSVPKFPQFALFDRLPMSCCAQMFAGCTSLTSIPENLFSNKTQFYSQSCSGMFNGCTSLTEIPVLVSRDLEFGAVYIERGAFEQIFMGCENVTYIDPNFFEWAFYPSSDYGQAIIERSAFDSMFYGLRNITIYGDTYKDPPGEGYELLIDTMLWQRVKIDVDDECGPQMFFDCVQEGYAWRENGTMYPNSEYQYWIQVIEK